MDQVPQGSQVVIIDENSSGLSQLADALKGKTNISAIHILSHGASDAITLGTDVLTADNLSAWSSQLSAIGASLSDSGDILLYGCDVSAQDNAFITRFAELTQADVAASSDMTGSALSNADNAWRVEVIADDRLRDASGNLTSANSANGGQNDAVTGVAAVPTTAIDPYGALPSGLSQNVSTACGRPGHGRCPDQRRLHQRRQSDYRRHRRRARYG